MSDLVPSECRNDIPSLALFLEQKRKLREENEEMRAEIAEKDAVIDQLRDASEPIIQTKDTSGAYTPEFRTVVYRLLGKNIPQANLSSAIQDVLVFAKKEASDLPTTKSIRRMNIERGDVAQQHVAVSCFEIVIHFSVVVTVVVVVAVLVILILCKLSLWSLSGEEREIKKMEVIHPQVVVVVVDVVCVVVPTGIS